MGQGRLTRCRRIWRDHSLSIVSTVIGTGLIVWAFRFDEGQVFDLLLGLGQGVLTAALVFILSGPLRERNRPEE